MCRYELFIDELPVWGFVGPPPEETKEADNIYIYTHKSFDINYNGNRVRPQSALPFLPLLSLAWPSVARPPGAACRELALCNSSLGGQSRACCAFEEQYTPY